MSGSLGEQEMLWEHEPQKPMWLLRAEGLIVLASPN